MLANKAPKGIVFDIMKTVISIISLLILGFSFGCSEALPPQMPQPELAESLQKTQVAAIETKSYAEQASLEIQTSKKLLDEMRLLTAKVKEAEARCIAAEKKIGAAQRAIRKAKEEPAVEDKPQPGLPKPQTIFTPKPLPTLPKPSSPIPSAPSSAGTSSVYPEFSPSDAPQ